MVPWYTPLLAICTRLSALLPSSSWLWQLRAPDLLFLDIHAARSSDTDMHLQVSQAQAAWAKAPNWRWDSALAATARPRLGAFQRSSPQALVVHAKMSIRSLGAERDHLRYVSGRVATMPVRHQEHGRARCLQLDTLWRYVNVLSNGFRDA